MTAPANRDASFPQRVTEPNLTERPRASSYTFTALCARHRSEKCHTAGPDGVTPLPEDDQAAPA
jgi:hypothetical protein